MDGLTETVTNKLMPSFELFQGYGIKAIEKIIDKLDAIDGEAIANEVKSIVDAFAAGDIAGVIEKTGGYLDKLPEGFKTAAAAAGALAGVGAISGILDSSAWKGAIAGAGKFKAVMGALPGAIGKNAKFVAKSIGGIGKGMLGILPSGASGKITGFFGHMADRAAETGRVFKMVGGVMWNNFANNSIAGKVVTRVGKVLGGVTGAVTKVGGRMASGLKTMMSLALKALMPAAVIGAALVGLGVLYSKFGDQIDNILQMAQEKGPQFITNLVSGITSLRISLQSSPEASASLRPL